MQEEAVEKPKKKILVKILSTLGWAVIGLLFLVSAINIIDRLSGYNFPFFGLRANVIVSESMAVDYRGTTSNYEFKQLQVNDVVITYTKGYDDIEIGDIVTFSSPKGLICHRVEEKYQSEGYNYLVTRGDSNNTSDSPIEFSKVKGKVVNVIPKAGLVTSFIQSPFMLMATGFSAFVIFGTMFVYKYTEEKKNKNKENETKNE